jgi:hypothetical protein
MSSSSSPSANLETQRFLDTVCRDTKISRADRAVDFIVPSLSEAQTLQRFTNLHLRQTYRRGDKLAHVAGTVEDRTSYLTLEHARRNTGWYIRDSKLTNRPSFRHEAVMAECCRTVFFGATHRQ